MNNSVKTYSDHRSVSYMPCKSALNSPASVVPKSSPPPFNPDCPPDVDAIPLGSGVIESDTSLESLFLEILEAGNFDVAEANGEPCSGSAKTYERLAEAEFLDRETERQVGGFGDFVEREERRLEGMDDKPRLERRCKGRRAAQRRSSRNRRQ